MRKKGITGEQFNWIFVMVAGAILLGFLVLFAFKYVEIAEARESMHVARVFAQSLRVLEGSEQVGEFYSIDGDVVGSGFRLEKPAKLSYGCLEGKGWVVINDFREGAQRLRHEVVFMPKDVRARYFDFGVVPWYYPYHAVNFILASPVSRRFYVVYREEDDLVKRMKRNLGDAFNVKFFQGRIGEVSGTDVKVLFIDVNPGGEIDRLRSKGYDVVYVDRQREKVYFGREEGSELFGDACVYAALFADDKDVYDCNMRIAFERVGKVGKVYAKKAEYLRGEGCNYAGLRVRLLRYVETAEKYAKGEVDAGSVRKGMESLKSSAEALRGRGCEDVF